MDGADISVYGEAKGEYTRQLCVFLVPCLESYFLELLEEAKGLAANPSKTLWHFQSLMQSIPDWNQDKVTKETERIQADCKCDYLEELLTAVFIAHTKVLSAIRLTTRQKKLQITIPKIDHFLHRVLSDSARALWTNAYLFAETNSIDKQKNLRQVSALLQESVLQGIRGLLPVKSILREYLNNEDEDEDSDDEKPVAKPEAKELPEEAKPEEAKPEEAKPEEARAEESKAEEAKAEESKAEESKAEEARAEESKAEEAKAEEAKAEEAKAEESKAEEAKAEEAKPPLTQPTIYIDTKPSVSFSQGHIMFDSDNLENNEIHDIPFAEAELRVDDEEDEENDIESVQIMDEVLPMEADEIL
jgi:chemotaxis protein histidine kinase CheA